VSERKPLTKEEREWIVEHAIEFRESKSAALAESSDIILSYEATVRALEAKASEDTKRLDWLGSTPNALEYVTFGEGVRFPSLREAITAAMSTPTAPETET